MNEIHHDPSGAGDMDRDEALRLLRGGPEGVAEWNNWMRVGKTIPDLAGVVLHRANLNGADLGAVNLAGADLTRADLAGAVLTNAQLSNAQLWAASLAGAYLGGAVLVGAKLHMARLTGANLCRADLARADLSAAHLIEANLTQANLAGANLAGAACYLTYFADQDLSKVIGLENINHIGQSEIAVSALVRSKGRIPESFLRGCGVPESLIAYLPSIISSMNPVQFYSCFISFSSEDEPFARRLYGDLVASGVRCWYAPETLSVGERMTVAIDEAIRLYDKFIVVLSKKALSSGWVRFEVERAIERERETGHTVLFPIRLDNSVLETRKAWASKLKKTRSIGNFTGWESADNYQKALSRLIRDLAVTSSLESEPAEILER